MRCMKSMFSRKKISYELSMDREIKIEKGGKVFSIDSIQPLMENNLLIACACDKVVSRELIEENHIRFRLGQMSEDIEWNVKLRMSFSTKIIDCLDSGCAVMAICDKKQGGYMYLKEKDAAICVDSPKMIEKALKNILNNPQSIQIYREKALKCGRENHLKEKILLDLQNDFCNITNF